jgi:cholesterol transport system auxiliary component
MKPTTIARTRHCAANQRPRTDGRRRLSLAVLAIACALVAGCSLLGGGGTRERGTIYAPDPRIDADPSWPTVQWQLAIGPATAARMTDSLRIAVRPTPDELQVYKGASWSRPPTQMLEDAVLRALEDSGRIGAVARQGSGINGNYKLVMDLRRFEADYAGAAVPSATIEVNAKLLHSVDQQVVASRTFLAARPAADAAVPAVVASFDAALADVTRQISGWILVAGEQHEQQPH